MQLPILRDLPTQFLKGANEYVVAFVVAAVEKAPNAEDKWSFRPLHHVINVDRRVEDLSRQPQYRWSQCCENCEIGKIRS